MRHTHTDRMANMRTTTPALARRLRATGLVATALLVGACGGDPPAATAQADSTVVAVLGPRDLAVAESREVTDGVTITGSLNPEEQVEVKAQVSGQLASITVDRGTRVRMGQAIAQLESRTAAALRSSAAAGLAAAERDFAATDTLYKAGAVSERDHIGARTALDAARAQLAQAEETLERSTIRAPITGVISDRAVSPGEAVRVGDKLFTVVNSDILEIVGQVSPAAIGGIRIGSRATLRLEAYPEREIAGRVARIEPVADPDTRQVGVAIHVPNANGSLVAGLFATGTIQTGTNVQVSLPTIPFSAVLTRGGESAVFVVEGDRIARRVVTLGARDLAAGVVSIQSGVAVGDRVLVNPTPDLTTGTPVRLLGDSPMAADTTGGR